MVNCGGYQEYLKIFDDNMSHLTDLDLMNNIKKLELEVLEAERSIAMYKEVLERRKANRELEEEHNNTFTK